VPYLPSNLKAPSLAHPWIGSEQGSPDSHEDHRFRHFLDPGHPSLGYEILDCHTTLTARYNNRIKFN
jgi:hypothetical protein